DFFFFASRRRHTRFSRDWSSDLCSSDLPYAACPTPREQPPRGTRTWPPHVVTRWHRPGRCGTAQGSPPYPLPTGDAGAECCELQIGRASCRERVEGVVGRERVRQDEATL